MSTENKSFTPASIKDCWQTPRAIFDYYNERFNFNMDVACSDENKLVSEDWLTEDDDALAYYTDWNSRNFCNPPYSDIAPWVQKAITQSRIANRLTVMLIPADTSVKWFKLAYENCTECHLISGRVSFVNADTQKPVNGNNKGSVVFIFDPLSPVKQSVHLIDRDTLMGVK